jgi:hypothetical protein
MAESFFAALKNERVYRTVYATKAQARRDVIAYIEGLYNTTATQPLAINVQTTSTTVTPSRPRQHKNQSTPLSEITAADQWEPSMFWRHRARRTICAPLPLSPPTWSMTTASGCMPNERRSGLAGMIHTVQVSRPSWRLPVGVRLQRLPRLGGRLHLGPRCTHHGRLASPSSPSISPSCSHWRVEPRLTT